MNRILSSLLLITLTSICCYAQLANERYVSRMTQDGTLYFINPHKLKELTNIKSFEYDMTLLNWTDSITINFTFESDMMELPNNLKIDIGNDVYECQDFHDLFIDIKKNRFEIRITSRYPSWVIDKMISSEIAPIFIFYQNGRKETASYKKNAWEKDRKKLKEIFKLYEYSKTKFQ